MEERTMIGTDNGLWIFALLILLFGGNGFNGRNGEAYATNADVQRGFDTAEIVRKEDEIKAGLSAGISDATFALNSSIMNEGRQTQSAIGAVSTQLAQCCCETNRNIDAVNYNLASAIHAEGEATRNLIQENKIETLRDKVNALELQNQLCGIVRYPQAMTYSYNANPFCNCNCGNI